MKKAPGLRIQIKLTNLQRKGGVGLHCLEEATALITTATEVCMFLCTAIQAINLIMQTSHLIHYHHVNWRDIDPKERPIFCNLAQLDQANVCRSSSLECFLCAFSACPVGQVK